MCKISGEYAKNLMYKICSMCSNDTKCKVQSVNGVQSNKRFFMES